MEILRQELIETQKARSELIKWKLLLVSALGATGLGFSKNDSNNILNAEVLLCCIPFVCAYVDAQLENLSLRIMGIAIFFRQTGSSIGIEKCYIKYEEYMAFAREMLLKTHHRLGRHSPQSWLIRSSSIVFSLFLIIYSITSFIIHGNQSRIWLTISMIVSGIIGIVFTLYLFHHGKDRRMILEQAGKEFSSKYIKKKIAP